MEISGSGHVIDLCTHPLSKRHHEPRLPDQEEAPVIDLFSHAFSDKQFFRRLQGLSQARIIDGRLWVEIEAAGDLPPEPWLGKVTFILTDESADYCAVTRIEAVVQVAGSHFLVKTKPLANLPPGDSGLTTNAMLCIASPTGLSFEQPFHPLLAAKPKP